MENFNWKLKEWAGTRTILEGKMVLAKRLVMAYSAAYDPLNLYGLDLDDRWSVSRDYTVSFNGEPWCSMTETRAFELANNPAHLMIRSGALETGIHQYRRKNLDWVDYASQLDKRIYMLPWINPNDTRDLENKAVDDYLHTQRLTAEAVKMKVKRPVFHKKRDKMIIESGHLTFDQQTVCLGTGNIWAPTLHGEWVRPKQQVYMGRRHYEKPGVLQDFDLGFFKDIRTPASILKTVKRAAKDRSVQFYALFHFYRRKNGREPKRIVHGYVLTDENDLLIAHWNTGPTYLSYNVLAAAIPYLAVQDQDLEV